MGKYGLLQTFSFSSDLTVTLSIFEIEICFFKQVRMLPEIDSYGQTNGQTNSYRLIDHITKLSEKWLLSSVKGLISMGLFCFDGCRQRLELCHLGELVP